MKAMQMSESLYEYITGHCTAQPQFMQQLRAETATMPHASMQVSPEQGAFLGMLARWMGAVRTIEVGVFTGYSSLSVALALPAHGRIVACDVSEEYTSVARRYWKQARVDQKITLRLGPASQTLEHLLEDGQAETFDMAFIDADKPGYDTYYEQCLKLVRPGGAILIDNVLWGGQVVDPSDHDASTVALRTLNEKIAVDRRVQCCMLAVADGLTLVRKHTLA